MMQVCKELKAIQNILRTKWISYRAMVHFIHCTMKYEIRFDLSLPQDVISPLPDLFSLG